MKPVLVAIWPPTQPPAKMMAAYGPKKDGSPNVKYFESPEALSAFELIRQWLTKNGKKVSVIK